MKLTNQKLQFESKDCALMHVVIRSTIPSIPYGLAVDDPRFLDDTKWMFSVHLYLYVEIKCREYALHGCVWRKSRGGSEVSGDGTTNKVSPHLRFLNNPVCLLRPKRELHIFKFSSRTDHSPKVME